MTALTSPTLELPNDQDSMFTPTTTRRPMTAMALLAMLTLLPGCITADRLAEIGRAPDLSRIDNPSGRPDYQPVNLPMPAVQTTERQQGSLWRAGARAFFKDQRANRIGDILTVTITINDQAQVTNNTSRTRANSEAAGLPGLFGFQRELAKLLPTAANDPLDKLVNVTSGSNSTGTGQIQRRDQVNLRVAAVVVQVLPNGNFVIEGRQEVRINFELRELVIRGVARPEDVNVLNEISYDKIAEARIAYGGRGQITDVQQPRYGQQVFDAIMPW